MKINLFFVVMIGLLYLSLLGCTKKSTQWSSQWVFPFIKDTLDLSNYHNDSTLDDSGLNYYVDFKRTLLDVRLVDYLILPDTTISQSFSPTIGIGNVPAGFTFYNSIETHEISIPNVELKKAIVSSGNILLKVYNPISTSAYYTVSMPGVALNGIDFQETFFVGAGTTETPTVGEALIDLEGYKLDLQGTGVLGSSNLSAFNILQTSLSIMSDPEGQNSSITTSDVFEFEAKFEDIKISYAQGYFGAQYFSDTTELEIPYLDKIISGSIDLNEVPFIVSIENGAKIPVAAQVTLVENTNYANNTESLQSSELNTDHFIAPATGTWNTLLPSTYQLILDGANSSMEGYLENMGHTHQIGYELRLNPFGSGTGSFNEIFPSSKIKVNVATEFPMAIGVNGLRVKDTIGLNISSLELNKIITAESISIHINSENAFPLEGGFILRFLDDNYIVMDSIIAENMIGSSLSGTLDTGDSLFKFSNQTELILTPSIVSEISTVKWISIEANLESKDSFGQGSVAIPSGAYIYFDAYLKLTTLNTIQ